MTARQMPQTYLNPILLKARYALLVPQLTKSLTAIWQRTRVWCVAFQQIDIKEPTVEEAVDILEGIKKGYANYHNVSYSKDIIRYIVENSHKHISNRFLPDKAIDLLDEAGAKLAKGMSKDDKGPCRY